MRQCRERALGAAVRADVTGRVIVVLRGVQDILGVLESRPVVIEAVRDSAGELIIDLGEVTFADESLIGLLALAYRESQREHGAALLVTSDRGLLGKLRVTGLDRLLPCFATVEEAIDALG